MLLAGAAAACARLGGRPPRRGGERPRVRRARGPHAGSSAGRGGRRRGGPRQRPHRRRLGQGGPSRPAPPRGAHGHFIIRHPAAGGQRRGGRRGPPRRMVPRLPPRPLGDRPREARGDLRLQRLSREWSWPPACAHAVVRKVFVDAYQARNSILLHELVHALHVELDEMDHHPQPGGHRGPRRGRPRPSTPTPPRPTAAKSRRAGRRQAPSAAVFMHPSASGA